MNIHLLKAFSAKSSIRLYLLLLQGFEARLVILVYGMLFTVAAFIDTLLFIVPAILNTRIKRNIL
jgi:hypothetical protein